MPETLMPAYSVVQVAPSSDQQLVSLDRKVDAAEGDGILARWEFGRALLARRVGKKLPVGELDKVARLIGKSVSEVEKRVQFAQRFPDRDVFRNAIAEYGSWYRIVTEALSSTAHLSSEKDEWTTPTELFAALDNEFGFTLDVCASDANHKCPRYFTAADDGLAQSWTDEVAFMNPPYSVVTEWMAKAHSHADDATVVCLVPSRTDVGWFWEHARHGEVRLIRGRLSFVDDEANTGPAPFPSVVVVFGPGRRGVHWWEP